MSLHSKQCLQKTLDPCCFYLSSVKLCRASSLKLEHYWENLFKLIGCCRCPPSRILRFSRNHKQNTQICYQIPNKPKAAERICGVQIESKLNRSTKYCKIKYLKTTVCLLYLMYRPSGERWGDRTFWKCPTGDCVHTNHSRGGKAGLPHQILRLNQ